MSVSTTLPTFPTTSDVLASLQAALQALNPLLTNYNAGGVTETYLEAASILVGSDASTYPGVVQKGAYELLTIVQTAEFILTASGNFLDLKAADVGVTRKAAVAASGPVQFYPTTVSSSVTLIPAGTIVAAESADPTALPIAYMTDTNDTIPANGTESVGTTVTAVNPGSSGNQATVGAINTVVSGVTGVTVASTQTIAGGADIEGDDTPNGGLRARALAAIPNASQCTISAIENAALSFAGITNAVAQDINTDPTQLRGVVQLYVDDGSGDLGNASNANYPILATMQTAFDSGLYRAAGVQVNVQGSELLATTVSLVLYVKALYVAQTASLASVVAAVQLAIYNYVQSVGIGQPVLLSEIITAACEVAGVADVPISSVQINGSGANLQPSAIQAPRLANLAAVTIVASTVTY
jgi:uncharacterized phage protein gp47/JayE